MNLDIGKYGEIIKMPGDIQYKILVATIAVANEDGERNRLLRIQLGLELLKKNVSEKKLLEAMLQAEIDLTDQAIV